MARRDRPPRPARPFTAPTPEQRRLRVALGVFGLVLLGGFIGYQVVERVTPLEALYMTVITVSTVGFQEVFDLSTGGRVLTIVLIASGVITASYAAVTAAEFVLEGHLRRYIERRRMFRDIETLDRHIIICGFGRVGRHIASALALDREDFVVVDSVPEKIRILHELDYLHVEGDATEEQILEEAGVDRARAVAACVHTDADNVLITLTVKGLNPDAVVIARAKADETESKLRRAGADRVIAPATIGGRRIAQLLTRPALADFLDAYGSDGTDYQLEEVPVSASSPLAGQTLRTAGIRERWRCTVLAIHKRNQRGVATHPSAETPLEPGDILVVMGANGDVTAMRDALT